MLVAIVDEWKADLKVAVVDEWRADVKVAVVDEWRAQKKVTIVDEWRADLKVAIVDEVRLPGGVPAGGFAGAALGRSRPVRARDAAFGVLLLVAGAAIVASLASRYSGIAYAGCFAMLATIGLVPVVAWAVTGVRRHHEVDYAMNTYKMAAVVASVAQLIATSVVFNSAPDGQRSPDRGFYPIPVVTWLIFPAVCLLVVGLRSLRPKRV